MKLHYLALRARGEQLRILMLHMGIAYDYVPVTFDEWPAVKPSMPKGKNGEQQLPVLELDDGTMMPESLDIAKHLCAQGSDAALCKSTLGGDCPEKAEAAWMYTDTLRDHFGFGDPLMNYFEVKDAEAKIPDFLAGVPAAYETLAKDLGDDPFFAGAAVSYGDFAVWHQMDLIRTLDGGVTLAKNATLQKYWDRMMKVPAVEAHWKATRTDKVGRKGSILESVADPPKLPSVVAALAKL